MLTPDQTPSKCPEGTVENAKGQCVPIDQIFTQSDVVAMVQGSRQSGQLVKKHLPKKPA